jgi:myo-inositol-1(or 4)-monophosphatase
MPRPAVNVAVRAARAAGAIILRYLNRVDSLAVEEKSRLDFVSEVDRLAEAEIVRELRRAYPDHAVLAEESGATGKSDKVWVIDPLDGTHNFAHGRRDFAVMVALAHRGETVGGWLHQPITGETQMAVRGEGASSGAGRLRVAAPAPVKEMVAALYIGAKRAPALHARAKELRAGALGPEAFHRSAGAEYLGLAAGRIHYAIFTLHLPWDHAPGALIFAEAGGYLAYWDGRPYRPSAALGIPLLLAPDAATWHQLRTMFG